MEYYRYVTDEAPPDAGGRHRAYASPKLHVHHPNGALVGRKRCAGLLWAFCRAVNFTQNAG